MTFSTNKSFVNLIPEFLTNIKQDSINVQGQRHIPRWEVPNIQMQNQFETIYYGAFTMTDLEPA